MYRDLMLQLGHSQQDYEREIRQLHLLGRLRRELREAREARKQAQKSPVVRPKRVTA